MENPTPVQQPAAKPKKGVSNLLIILVLVILLGGGAGLYFYLRPKKDEDETPNNTTTDAPVQGRTDLSDKVSTGLPPELVGMIMSNYNPTLSSGGSGSSGTDTPPDPPKPMYIGSQTARDLIQNQAQIIQSNVSYMDHIRLKYHIGRALSKHPEGIQKAIDKLFGQLPGVNVESNLPYLTYPIYGTLEEDGKQIRFQLQKVLDKDPLGFTLSDARHGDSPWWIETAKLNLMTGTTSGYTWTPHQIWAYQASREDLDWFKDMNQLPADDHDLLGKEPDGRPWYWASGMLDFVRKWVQAIDRLDEVVEWEAIRALTYPIDKGGYGHTFLYTDPTTGDTSPEPTDPADNSTNIGMDDLLT